MKKFVIPLLGTIFVLLLTYSTESVAADHLLPGEGIWKDENHINLIPTKDSKYHVHLHLLDPGSENHQYLPTEVQTPQQS